MPVRTLFQRWNRPGRGAAAPPVAACVLSASRSLAATAFDSQRPAWERLSPLLLLAILSTLPLVAFISGAGSLFIAWLVVAYLLTGYLWVEAAAERADQSHQWRAFMLAGVGLAIVALALPTSAGAVLACAIGFSAVGGLVAGIRLHAPTQPIPWYLVAAALGLAEAGRLIAAVWTLRNETTPPAAGLVSLAGLLLLPVALWLLLHRRARGSSRTVLLDTAIVSSGLAMLAWVYLIATHVTNPASTAIEQAVVLGWPLAGFAATVVGVRFLLTRWPADIVARQFAGAALVLLIAAITASSWMAANATEPATHPGASALWLLALVGFGAAALHPSMTQLTTPIHEQPPELNWQRSLLLTLALLMAPVALLAQSTRGDRPTIEAIGVGAILLGLLFAARMLALQRARITTLTADRALRLAAADLVVTRGRNAIVETAIDAAHAIGGAAVTSSLYLSDGAPGDFVCLRSTTSDAGTSRVISERDLPPAVRPTLAAGTSAWLSADDIAGLRGPLGLADSVAAVSIAPLCGEQGLRGLLVSAGNGLTHEVARCQETLAALLALALDRQRLADELGYQPGRAAHHARAADGTTFTFIEVDTPEPTTLEDVEFDDAEPSIAGVLRAAIEEDHLIARYQPRLDLAHGRITGVEMIPAWDSPLVGPIPRNALSAIAAEHGLSQPLRLALLLRACRQHVDWHARHPGRTLDVAVPLGLAEIEASGLAEDVGLALADSNCDPSRLILELTASTLLEADDSAIAELSSIAAVGVQIAVSEAGAAWSSLERLCSFPISVFELEGSLVNRLDSDERAAAIGAHIVGLAHSRGARVVAHGIERRESWVQLRKLNCDLGQGALFSAPVDADAVSALLDRAQQRATGPVAA